MKVGVGNDIRDHDGHSIDSDDDIYDNACI